MREVSAIRFDQRPQRNGALAELGRGGEEGRKKKTKEKKKKRRRREKKTKQTKMKRKKKTKGEEGRRRRKKNTKQQAIQQISARESERQCKKGGETHVREREQRGRILANLKPIFTAYQLTAI